MIPDASEMANSLDAACQALHDANVLEDECWSCFCSTVSQLRAKKKELSWYYSVSASNPLTFKPIINDHLSQIITPRIYATVEVDEALCEGKVPPFVNLNSVIQVSGEDGRTIFRSHMDMAEKNTNGQYQHAPLFHLQLGGHHPGADRKEELRLKEPRLPYPPIDLLLACEIVVSNFFPHEWRVLRSNPSWITAICQSQQLCLPAYIERLSSCLNVSSYTASQHLWADAWGV